MGVSIKPHTTHIFFFVQALALMVGRIIMSIVEEFIEQTHKTGMYAFDVEHLPELELHQTGFTLHGCSFSNNIQTFYVKNPVICKQITDALFPCKQLQAIAFNGKYDIQCLKQSGWADKYPETLVDPMIALNLLDDNKQPNQLGLKENVLELFGHQMMTFPQAHSFGMDSPQFTKYACDDALWEFRLWERLRPELEHQKLLKYFLNVPAIAFFADVETAGVMWDLDNSRQLMRDYVKVRDDLEEEIYSDIGLLNLDSPKQLATRLFEDLGYSSVGLRRTDKGAISTDADTLEELAHKHPVCAKIVKYRTAAKMLGTYVVPLATHTIEKPDRRIHPKFWLVSSTGRTRCDSPNLQNIPAHLNKDFKHLDIRKMFIARPGYKFCVFDYSQIELRLMAHFSKDHMFLKAYREWQCTACNKKGSDNTILHKCPLCGCPENEQILKDKTIAGFWHGLDLHQITSDKVGALKGYRQAGKTANFALIYKAGAKQMNTVSPDYTVQEWQVAIDEYFQVYTGVAHWHTYMENILTTQHETRDIFGRKRRIHPFLIKKSFKHALNQIVNFPPQASAAGMIQLASTKFRKRMLDLGYWMKEAVVVNSVHDETDMEIREDKVDEVISIMQDTFEHIVSLEVPVRLGIGIGLNWEDAK